MQSDLMKRTSVLISMLLVASGGLAGCASTTSTASPSVGRFTLQVTLDATRADVGSQISGTEILRNETNKPISWSGCSEDSVAVGLVGHGATFNPLSGGTACVGKIVFKPHSSVRFPVTVETTYDGCGHTGVPVCPHNGIPLLPLGSYSVDIVNFGLPASIHFLPTPKVTLVNATTGRSTGPIGGSILIQAYGCESLASQPPIAVTLTSGDRVIAKRNKLGVTQEMIVGVRPGSYTIRSSVRPDHLVHVINGVQAVAVVIPHCY
jgi:hypothetical protein